MMPCTYEISNLIERSVALYTYTLVEGPRKTHARMKIVAHAIRENHYAFPCA